MKFGIFRNSREKQHKRKPKNVDNKESELLKGKMMPFSYGLNELRLDGVDKKAELIRFKNSWFNSPKEYLNF